MFKGSIPALVTPLRPDGTLDLEAWDRLVDFHLAEGSDALVVGGTTGESPALTSVLARRPSINLTFGRRSPAAPGAPWRAPHCSGSPVSRRPRRCRRYGRSMPAR